MLIFISTVMLLTVLLIYHELWPNTTIRLMSCSDQIEILLMFSTWVWDHFATKIIATGIIFHSRVMINFIKCFIEIPKIKNSKIQTFKSYILLTSQWNKHKTTHANKHFHQCFNNSEPTQPWELRNIHVPKLIWDHHKEWQILTVEHICS